MLAGMRTTRLARGKLTFEAVGFEWVHMCAPEGDLVSSLKLRKETRTKQARGSLLANLGTGKDRPFLI